MTIRTPDDEIDRAGFYYPPFREGWHYVGATYPGHSSFSVDWNRRTKTGGWLDDTGDPVLAPADGTVAEVDKSNGLVMLNHWGGLYRTEFRHMQDIVVGVGDKVRRGDLLGGIGNVAGDGRSFGAHLHHVQYRRNSTTDPWRRVRQSFYGKPVEVSVRDSDSRPASWTPPTPVMFQGPPPRATWESAYKEAQALADKRAEQLEAQKAQTRLATEERDRFKADFVATAEQRNQAQSALERLRKDFDTLAADMTAEQALTGSLRARIVELEARPGDCSAEVDRALFAERKLDDIRAVLAR